jgi:glycosyltransferase involved in cell wall biosynthesis
MNILFLSIDGDPIHAGGTATIVQAMAKWFMEKGNFCSLGYVDDFNPPSTFFKEKIKISLENEEEIKKFNRKHLIDIVYMTKCMGVDWELLHRCFPMAKFVAAYHNRPLLRYAPFCEMRNQFMACNSLKDKLRWGTIIATYPLSKYKSQRKELHDFKEMVKYSDKIQLLSTGFYPVFKRIVPHVKDNQLIAIGNPALYKEQMPPEDILKKEKTVLIVSNANMQKRAHLAIEAWAEIEKDSAFDDWNFVFVGGSIEVDRLKKLAQYKYKFKRALFTGRQSPLPYYQKASIFLLTSRFEGWPMVLVEAMQMGVVGVAFNSYESLSDIINDRKDGIIVPNNNMKRYVKELKWLMAHNEERIQMAKEATKIAERYSLDSIMNQYNKLFHELIAQG